CSGTLGPEEKWTVDLRPEARPRVIASGTHLPFRDGSFRAVMMDPPYSDEYARKPVQDGHAAQFVAAQGGRARAGPWRPHRNPACVRTVLAAKLSAGQGVRASARASGFGSARSRSTNAHSQDWRLRTAR